MMNIDTGELKMISDAFTDDDVKAIFGPGFTPVPDDLHEETSKEIGDKQSTFIELKKKTPLTKWVKKERKNKKKAKKKMTKASRKVNR